MAHSPCPQPNCSSSDAYKVYDDGSGYCFSCMTYTRPKQLAHDRSLWEANSEVHFQHLDWRGVSSKTFKKFKVSFKCVGDAQEPVEVCFPYQGDAMKIRKLDVKSFYSKGSMATATLFGKSVFNEGGARAITVTEGELDALSVYEMMGDYPVVSVRSASSAKKDCEAEFEYLNSFEKIILCFDGDEPGRLAAKKVASLFDFNKVYMMNLTKYKDANDYLTHKCDKEFRASWFNAKRYLPEGIISSFEDIKKELYNDTVKPSVSYPFKTLQDMTYGIRTGETVLVTAKEGIGKTEIIRAIEKHIIEQEPDDVNLGIIHLEEPWLHTVKGFASLSLQQPCHLPDSQVTKEDILKHYEKLVRKDDRVHIYSLYGSHDPDIFLNSVRFLVAKAGCKYIFFDHITKIVTGMENKDERQTLDYLTTKLDMMTKELDFALIMVSHVNDDNLTRGSRNISKEAAVHIHLSRDLQNPNPILKNTTHLALFKNRFGAETGPAGKLLFDKDTWTLHEQDEIDEALPKGG